MPLDYNLLREQLSELWRKAETLDAANIPESRKSISVSELDIPIRAANVILNTGVYNIWDLVHKKDILKYCNAKSPPLLSLIVDAIDQSIKVLTGEQQLPGYECAERSVSNGGVA